MAGKPRFTVQQVIDAINSTHGMVYLAAKALGCSHNTVYKYAKRHPTIQQAIDANRGRMLDTAESKLEAAIETGESWAVQFALRTLGKNRGYVERRQQEISGRDGGPLVVGNVTLNDKQRARAVQQLLGQFPEIAAGSLSETG